MSYCNLTSNHMYPNDNVCLFERDIYGDPLYCPSSEHLMYCEHHECPGMFRCNGDYCIPKHMVCDGVVDCTHEQDEHECDAMLCQGGLLCKSNDNSKTRRCIHPHNICDGIVHCHEYQDDEMDCFLDECSEQCACNVHVMTCSEHQLHITIPSNIKMIYIYRATLRIVPNIKRNNHVLTVKLVEVDSSHIVAFLRGMFFLRELNFLSTNIHSLYRNMFQDCWALHSLIFISNPIFYVEDSAFLMTQHFYILLLNLLHIKHVSNDAFMGSHNIEILDLSHNDIKHLHRSVFNGLSSIIFINLTGNFITMIDIGIGSSLSRAAIVLMDDNEQCCNQRALNCFYLVHDAAIKYQEERCHIHIKSTLLRTGNGITGVAMLCIFVACIMNYKRYFGKCVTRNFTLVVLLAVDAIVVVYPFTIALGIEYYNSADVYVKSKWVSSTHCIISSSVILIWLLMSSLCWFVISALSLWVTKYALVRKQITVYKVIWFLCISFCVVLLVVGIVKYTLPVRSNICLMFAKPDDDDDWRTYLTCVLLAMYFLGVHSLTTVMYRNIIHYTAKSGKRANVNNKRTQLVKRKASIFCSVKFILWLHCFTLLVLPVFLHEFDSYVYSYIFLLSVILNQLVDAYLFMLF